MNYAGMGVGEKKDMEIQSPVILGYCDIRILGENRK